MSLYIYFYVVFFVQISFCAFVGNSYVVESNDLSENDRSTTSTEFDLITYLEEIKSGKEKVAIQLYYECLCLASIEFYTQNLTTVVLKLAHYLNITTYPYGNARTFEHNGKYEFKCQHGPQECYGNKLHACALDLLQNKTEALLFNACMMKPNNNSHGSDDGAADACGKAHNVDATSIKKCAKGDKGIQLLKYYGDESEKAHFNYVPYILINGEVNGGDNFMRDVCAAFINPPSPCYEI